MGARFNVMLLGVIILAVVVGVIAGQSQPRTVAAPVPTSTAGPLPLPPPGIVVIADNPPGSSSVVYLPSVLVVHVGQVVTWGNATTEDHSVIADNSAFNSDVLGPDQIFRWKAKTPGRYPYSDFLHPELRGTIVVQP